MKHPALALAPVPRGPLDDVWTRLDGQFWIKLALYSTDLPKNPERAPPPLFAADRHSRACPKGLGLG